MVRMPLTHGFMDFLGRTIEVGIVEKRRQVEWSFSHLSYICTFMTRRSIRWHGHHLGTTGQVSRDFHNEPRPGNAPAAARWVKDLDAGLHKYTSH